MNFNEGSHCHMSLGAALPSLPLITAEYPQHFVLRVTSPYATLCPACCSISNRFSVVVTLHRDAPPSGRCTPCLLRYPRASFPSPFNLIFPPSPCISNISLHDLHPTPHSLKTRRFLQPYLLQRIFAPLLYSLHRSPCCWQPPPHGAGSSSGHKQRAPSQEVCIEHPLENASIRLVR
jgi:hypothetical protein